MNTVEPLYCGHLGYYGLNSRVDNKSSYRFLILVSFSDAYIRCLAAEFVTDTSYPDGSTVPCGTPVSYYGSNQPPLQHLTYDRPVTIMM